MKSLETDHGIDLSVATRLQVFAARKRVNLDGTLAETDFGSKPATFYVTLHDVNWAGHLQWDPESDPVTCAICQVSEWTMPIAEGLHCEEMYLHHFMCYGCCELILETQPHRVRKKHGYTAFACPTHPRCDGMLTLTNGLDPEVVARFHKRLETCSGCGGPAGEEAVTCVANHPFCDECLAAKVLQQLEGHTFAYDGALICDQPLGHGPAKCQERVHMRDYRHW
jgi:hypothetical protein